MITEVFFALLETIFNSIGSLLGFEAFGDLPTISSLSGMEEALEVFNEFVPIAEIGVIAAISIWLLPPYYVYCTVMWIYEHFPFKAT